VYFVVGDPSTNECPEGSWKLTSPDQCMWAAAVEGEDFNRVFHASHIPSGCYQWVGQDKFNFNTHPVGGPHSNCMPVCMRGTIATTTVSEARTTTITTTLQKESPIEVIDCYTRKCNSEVFRKTKNVELRCGGKDGCNSVEFYCEDPATCTLSCAGGKPACNSITVYQGTNIKCEADACNSIDEETKKAN